MTITVGLSVTNVVIITINVFKMSLNYISMQNEHQFLLSLIVLVLHNL